MDTKVLIIMGSDSDYPVLEVTANVLKQFGVPFEMHVSSAHRSPTKTEELVSGAVGRGIKVIIAAAGVAAHLPGGWLPPELSYRSSESPCPGGR